VILAKEPFDVVQSITISSLRPRARWL
jgi:hypothetical protein